MRTRISLSVALGSAIGLFCWFLMRHLGQGAADLTWALHLANRLIDRQNPYDTPFEQYPLTAAFFAFPLLRLRLEVAAGVFYGISTTALALGLSQHGYRRLLIFFAYPYWAGLLTVQWSPLVVASAFFPLLLPVTLAKPQIGLPIFLTRATPRGVLACAVLFALSLVVMPNWLPIWLAQIGQYQHFIPLLVLPGALLLLALLRLRDPDAVLLLLAACMPQRWFFDSFILWLIPKSRREIVWTVFFSWGACIWRWYHVPHSFTQVGRWTVIFIYLPMLAVILLRSRPETQEPAAGFDQAGI